MEEMQSRFQAFDEWAINYLTERSEWLFGRTLTQGLVMAAYRPLVVQKEIGALVRAKISTTRNFATKFCTDTDFNERQQPDEFKGALLRLKILISHLWISGAHSSRFVLVAADAVIVSEARQIDRACPLTRDPGR